MPRVSSRARRQSRKPRYRAALLERFALRRAGEPVFVTAEGRPLAVETLGAYLAELRGVRINMEFNGALCRGLKNTRYKELEVVDGEPTLVDFIMDRVPPGRGRQSGADLKTTASLA